MKLEINGNEVDYKGEIAISRQSFDANNLSIRLIDITNRITLDETARNKSVINGARRLESDSLDVLYDCKIIDSFFLFSGDGILSNVGKEWKIQLADSSKMFFNDLKAKLKELDFESDDFIYNSTSYTALKNLTSSVWVWPIVQMHESEPETDLQYLRPHFAFWNILNKIFTSRSWTLQSDTTFLQNIALQANSEDFIFTSYQKTLNGTSLGLLDVNDFEYTGITVTANTINVGTVKTKFRLRGSIQSDGLSKITFNDDEIALRDGINDYDETTSELEGFVTITLVGSATFNQTLLYTAIEESSFDDLDTFDPTGYRVKAYDNLPDFSQLDLFKDALTLTLSIIIPDGQTKTIQLKTLSNLSTQNKADWSDKFIIDSENIKSSLDGLAKKNNLTYSNGVGDNEFLTNLEYLNDEDDYIELRYAGSPDKQYFSVYNIYVVDSDGNNVRGPNTDPRIVYLDGDNAKFQPLNWDALKTTFYNDYFNLSLNKPRQVDALFNLKKIDLLSYDPLQLVYVDKFNSNFIVEKIDQFIPGKLTKVRLLRYGR